MTGVAVPRAERPAAEFSLGDATPKRVFAPRTFAELAEALRAADRAGDAAVLFGGGTLQTLGSPPSRYDTAIVTSALDRTLAHEFKDFTIAVEAGQTLETFARTLAERGQFVPIDAPRARESTLGGALAAGWLGPRRAAYGRPRDFLIGSTVALADGSLASAGGMVVKNVTGYDTSRLYVGSLGTLAALARANFKTLALPQARRMALAPLPEGTLAHALANVAALRPEPSLTLAVRGFDAEIDGRSGLDGRILVLFEGSRATVEASMRALRSALGSAGVAETDIEDDVERRLARAVDAYVAPLGMRSATYRRFGDAATVLERAARIAQFASRAGMACETICDARTGDVVARVSRPDAQDFEEAARAFDGALRAAHPAIQLLSIPARVRAALAREPRELPALKTMLALKRRFDPNGTLAPGRFGAF